MYVPSAFSKRSEIEAAIREVEMDLAPDVVRIRYEIGRDWSDQWSIFFRIVLPDDAAKNRIREMRSKVVRGLADRLDFAGLGVYSYHNFRSVSEQARVREEAWA
jgi:hypothetical protein